MASSLAEAYARNLAEQIRQTARDREYIRWALEARSQYVALRLRQDPEIRKLYEQAARRAGELAKVHAKGGADILLRRRWEHLSQGLQEIARLFTDGYTATLKKQIVQAVEAGTGYSRAVTLSLVRQAGWSTGPVVELFAQVNQQAVEVCWARTKNGLFLSDRIWQQGQNLRDAMREIIQVGVATGMDAKTVARALEQYVESGALTLAKQYPHMMERLKGRIPKNLTYEGLRLARTEMTAAYGEGTIAAARVSPSYRGMKWILSKAHPLEDVCDTLADADEFGLGPGVYYPGDEPVYPAHPNCLCVLVPVHETPEEFVERLKRWQENPQVEPELENWYNEVYRGTTGLTTGTHLQEGTEGARASRRRTSRPPLYVEIDDLPEEARVGLASAWEEARKYGLANGKETALHVSATTGAQVYAQEFGDGSSVKFSQGLIDFLLSAEPESVLSAHNHPSSSAFSAADINVACAYRSFKYMTVVGHDQTRYLLKIGDGERPSPAEVGVAYDDAVYRYLPYYQAKVASREMTEQQAWREHSHRVMQDLARKFGWEYRRLSPDGKED